MLIKDLRATGRGITPMTNITPFTYRDGLTFQRLLYMLKDYLLDVVEPHFTAEITRIIEEFNRELNRIEEQYENDHADMRETIEDFIERIEKFVKDAVDPVAEAAVKKYLDAYINDPGNLSLFKNVFASKAVEDTARKQAILYTSFYSKLRYSQDRVTICALGDSTTYGYDLNSVDRIPAPTEALPDGTFHARDRSPRPYPLVLETRLRSMYGPERISVINRGYSGDTTPRSFRRWITGHGADLTIISMGINDAGSTDINITEHFDAYEQLILREINEYNSAVVILTPFRQSSLSNSRRLDAYRAGSLALAQKYGIPVVDAEPWLSNFDKSVFSDNTHMNTKGYEIIGTRAAALFVSNGPLDPHIAYHGTRYGVRPTVDPILYGVGSGIFNSGSGSGTPGEDTEPGANAGMFALVAETDIYYSFYTSTADMEVSFGLGMFPGTTVNIELDFGIEQGDNLSDHLVGLHASEKKAVPTLAVTTAATANVLIPELRYQNRIRISSPGWHTIRISNTGGASTRIYGIDFLSNSTFIAQAVRIPFVVDGDANVTGVGAITWGYNNAEVTIEGRIAVANAVANTWYKVGTLPVKARGLYYFSAEITGSLSTRAGVRVSNTGLIEVALSAPSNAGIMLNAIRFIPSFDFNVT